MKTAVSLPDRVFREAEGYAKRHPRRLPEPYEPPKAGLERRGFIDEFHARILPPSSSIGAYSPRPASAQASDLVIPIREPTLPVVHGTEGRRRNGARGSTVSEQSNMQGPREDVGHRLAQGFR